MWSTVLAQFASTAGWRYVMPNTSEPRRTRSVAIARPAIAAVASNVGEIVSPACWSSPMKWSAT